MITENKVIGTLLPLFSLYSKKNQQYVNGVLDDGILFIDWLRNTNQHAWQLLPIHETEFYSNSSTYNLSPYKGFGIGIHPKFASVGYRKPTNQELDLFRKEAHYWLFDYSLFCALRDYFHTDDWTKWPEDARDYNYTNIQKWRDKLKNEILRYESLQWQLHTQYYVLKEKAHKNDIILIGDMQFYLPLKSPIVWKYKNLFLLDERNNPEFVSGIPFKKGVMYGRQMWGHPLYDWEDTSKYTQIISIFKKRLAYLSGLYSMVRIDHTSGFFRYGKLDKDNPDKDIMTSGPGSRALNEIYTEAKNKKLLIFAEDAGYDIGSLRGTLIDLKIPGVRVLRCAYDEKNKQFSDIHAKIFEYPENSVAYTTTHDTETLIGYLYRLTAVEKKIISEKTGIIYEDDVKNYAINIVKSLLRCPSHFVIIPFQDWFLTTERINIPGTEESVKEANWNYRISTPIEDLSGYPALSEFQTILTKQANTSE